MLRKKKSFIKMAVVALFTVTVLASCSPSKPAPQFTLRIGWFSAPDHLPYFVMIEQGFDKKNGLKMEEMRYQGGAAEIEAMVTGSLDVGYIGTVPVIAAAERGLVHSKIVPVAAAAFADPEHPGVNVLVAHSINSWRDLRGKHIAVNAVNSISGAAIKGRMKKEGIPAYTLVEIPSANMGLAVAGGNVAAAVMSEPFLTQSSLRNDGKAIGWIIGGPPYERLEFSLIVFRTDFYRNNPQAVKAFLRAHLKAAKWINQNPDRTRSILTKQLGLSQEVGQRISILRFPSDGRNDPALLERMQPLLIDIEMLKTPIPAHKLYDETLLEEVLKEQK